MNAFTRCTSISDLPIKDRRALAQCMLGLIHEEPDETAEAVLSINMILSGAGLQLEDLARHILEAELGGGK